MFKVLLLPFIILTTSCSIFKGQNQVSNSQPNNSAIERELMGVAHSIERSLGTLAMAQEAHNPPLMNTAPLITPEGGMGGRADIDWTGPIEPLLKKIAEMSEYQVKIFGTEPAIPLIVSITQQNAVIADILKNASLQASKGANIMVFPANRIIELRYRTL